MGLRNGAPQLAGLGLNCASWLRCVAMIYTPVGWWS